MTEPAGEITVDGRHVPVAGAGESLMEVLRGAGFVSVKDGCSPQGQCGCCTVLVDGAPRVSCVTPARRVVGRTVTTVDGLDRPQRDRLVDAFVATGASQCGFCTPGILCRLVGCAMRGGDLGDRPTVDRALAAHLCRCTGWQTIVEAAALASARDPGPVARPSRDARATTGHPGRDLGAAAPQPSRDAGAAARRATIEGGVPQRVGPDVVLGRGGFADDSAPEDALVALPGPDGEWAVAETLAEARALAAAVQGRRTTRSAVHPLALPEGEWMASLRTTWVEPAYLEADASWCRPGGEPASPLANGGAFGGKVASEVRAAARMLADRHRRPVRVLLPRQEVVRRGPKRPPVAGGVRADGTGILRVVATPGVADVVGATAPGLVVEEVVVPGPATSLALRGAGWVEASLLASVADERDSFAAPGGGRASATVAADGTIDVEVRAGDPLDEVTLRSYCVGAAHMALSWVTSEALAVDDQGVVHDLTIRSFGVLAAAAMPTVRVHIDAAPGPPVNGSDAVFAAVAAAVWQAAGRPVDWPIGPIGSVARPVGPTGGSNGPR